MGDRGEIDRFEHDHEGRRVKTYYPVDTHGLARKVEKVRCEEEEEGVLLGGWREGVVGRRERSVVGRREGEE